MAASGTPQERTNCCTRHRGVLRMLNICVVLGLVIFMIVSPNASNRSMLAVYSIACILTLLSEFPYTRIKQYFWTPACVLFILGCVIAGIVYCTLDDTWEPAEFDDTAGDVIGLFAISIWMIFVVIFERWGVNGIYHNRANYNPEKGLAKKRDGTQASTQASMDPVAQVV
jgi:hypothetical protein